MILFTLTPTYKASNIFKSCLQETVVFEWGSFDVRTKEKAMKVVCEFPGTSTQFNSYV